MLWVCGEPKVLNEVLPASFILMRQPGHVEPRDWPVTSALRVLPSNGGKDDWTTSPVGPFPCYCAEVDALPSSVIVASVATAAGGPFGACRDHWTRMIAEGGSRPTRGVQHLGLCDALPEKDLRGRLESLK